jgi:hypothetical protein
MRRSEAENLQLRGTQREHTDTGDSSRWGGLVHESHNANRAAGKLASGERRRRCSSGCCSCRHPSVFRASLPTPALPTSGGRGAAWLLGKRAFCVPAQGGLRTGMPASGEQQRADQPRRDQFRGLGWLSPLLMRVSGTIRSQTGARLMVQEPVRSGCGALGGGGRRLVVWCVCWCVNGPQSSWLVVEDAWPTHAFAVRASFSALIPSG